MAILSAISGSLKSLGRILIRMQRKFEIVLGCVHHQWFRSIGVLPSSESSKYAMHLVQVQANLRQSASHQYTLASVVVSVNSVESLHQLHSLSAPMAP